MNIIVINPGATSTKVAYFNNDTMITKFETKFSLEVTNKFNDVKDQFSMRLDAIINGLKEHNVDLTTVDAVVGRGGILPPVQPGAIEVTDELINYLLNKSPIKHPSNLGAGLAKEISKKCSKDCRTFIYDPITVDQLSKIARISGLKQVERKSVGHMLNMRAVAIKTAKDLKKNYEDCTFIVVHAGTGISISVHEKGKMIDILGDDEGPFSTERTGGLPLRDVMKLYKEYGYDELMRLHRRTGGLISYLNTNNLIDIEKDIDQNNNQEASFILEALAYQIAKGVGTLAPVVNGNVDKIILTGGMAHSKRLTKWIIDRIKFISDVVVIPGEFELEALAGGTLRVLRNEETPHKIQL